jgi:hypothetical protein
MTAAADRPTARIKHPKSTNLCEAPQAGEERHVDGSTGARSNRVISNIVGAVAERPHVQWTVCPAWRGSIGIFCPHEQGSK